MYSLTIKVIRAVEGQRSSPELRLANKTKMHLKQKTKMNSKSLEYEDVLYFDLQPHHMACTLWSVVKEWKQSLQGSYIWKTNAFWWLTDMIQTFHLKIPSLWPWPQSCDLELKVNDEVGMEQQKILDQYLTSVKYQLDPFKASRHIHF